MKRGRRLRAFAACLFDAQTMERVIDPAIADLQLEPVSVTCYLAVLKTIVLCVPEVSMRIRNVAIVSAAVVVFVMAVLTLPFLQYAAGPRMIVFLLPQGFSIAIAVALMFGTLAALQTRRPTRRAVAAVLVVAALASVVSFVNAGWITPAANRSFRELYVEHAGGPPLQRGFTELTLGEVREKYALATRSPQAFDSTDLHYLAVSYHGRWAVTVAPLVFAQFAFVLCGMASIRRWALAAAVSVGYLAYVLSMTVPRLPALDGPWLGGAAWYPELAIAAMTFVLMFMHRREEHVAAG